jgi:hypothetical protein
MLAGSGTAQEAACPPWEPESLRGWQVRTAVGPAIWFGDIGQVSHPGLAFSFETGYEFFSWLAVEASFLSGYHSTNQPAPPLPGTFNTQALHAGLRLSLPLGAFDLFLRGGVGLMWSRPDILVRIESFDGQTQFGWRGGLGFYAHTPRRRVFLGAEVSALGGMDVAGILLMGTGVLGVVVF